MTTTAIRTNDHALAHIIDRTPFANRGHSLWSEWTGLPGMGAAPDSVIAALVKATENYTVPVYVVYSYSTPIGWARREDDELTVPDIRYSTTTTQHQGMALGGRPVLTGRTYSFDTDYVTTGHKVKMGDPGQVRKGRGHSPFTVRGGW